MKINILNYRKFLEDYYNKLKKEHSRSFSGMSFDEHQTNIQKYYGYDLQIGLDGRSAEIDLPEEQITLFILKWS